jgi:multiple sugar transport system ATP-binding protein
VALGRALVREASAHLLDEPIAHLDAKLRHRMRETLKRRQRQQGVTTLWATPDQLEAVSMADRAVVLNQGVVEQWGTPQELYRHPANEFVARSIGEPPMNILDAKVSRDPDGWRVEVAGARLPLPPGALGGAPRGDGHVHLGIRPSDIKPFPHPPEGPALEAEVFLYEPLGSYGVLTVQATGKTLKVRTDASIHFEAGRRVWLVPDGERSYFFHPQTGLAIAG